MSAINNSGMAIPHNVGPVYAGMELRDYFAAKALDGILANSEPDFENQQHLRDNFSGYCDSVAESAYEYADAMMKARAL